MSLYKGSAKIPVGTLEPPREEDELTGREENKKWITEVVERLAREAGHGNVRFHSWEFCEYVDPSELDPNKYTGPAGEVWQLILAEEMAQEPIASIGLTEKEIDGCKTHQSEVVSTRLHDAIGKLGSILL